MTTPSSNGNGRPFRDDLCLAIMAIPGYSLTDCAVLLWVAKRTFWGKTDCTALPSRITRELGGKIAIRTIQCSLRRFELDGLTLRSNLKSGPYPNRETSLTEKFWETIQSVLAKIEPRRYGSASTQFCAPYARTAHGDARFAHGDARSGAPHIEERARSSSTRTSTRSSSSLRAQESGDDDDDGRSASQKSGGSKQKAKPLSDAEGTEMVCAVAAKLAKLPGLSGKIRKATDLPHRVKHDWRLLAAAFVRLDKKVAAGEAKPKDPVAYALAMFPEMRSKDFPSADLDELYANVERLQKSEEQLTLELLNTEYGVTLTPTGYEPIDAVRWPDGLPADFKSILPQSLRKKVGELAPAILALVQRKAAR